MNEILGEAIERVDNPFSSLYNSPVDPNAPEVISLSSYVTTGYEPTATPNSQAGVTTASEGPSLPSTINSTLPGTVGTVPGSGDETDDGWVDEADADEARASKLARTLDFGEPGPSD